jgi:ABC-2 type transport system permease protein
MLNNNEILLNRIGYLVPTSLLVAWGLNVMTPMSLVWIILLLVVAVASLWILVQVGKRFYLNSLASGSVARKSKALSADQRKKKLLRRRSKALAIFFMDMQNMLRTPIFLFNNVSVVIIVPLCLLLGLTFSGIDQSDLSELQSFYQTMPFVVTYILIGIFIFFGATAATTATSFSREGKASWMTRVIPVSTSDQIIGRTLSALLIQGLGMIFTVAVVFYIIPLKLETIVMALLLGLVGSMPILLLGLFVDASRPLIN